MKKSLLLNADFITIKTNFFNEAQLLTADKKDN